MPKHPGGRPTKYTPTMCDIVIDKMAMGCAIDELPYYLDVCVDTIYEWIKKNPEFADAIKKGRSFSKAFWMVEGRESLRDKDFNYTGWYMNMKNRHGWRDKFESSHEIAITKVEEESRDNERDCYNEF